MWITDCFCETPMCRPIGLPGELLKHEATGQELSTERSSHEYISAGRTLYPRKRAPIGLLLWKSRTSG